MKFAEETFPTPGQAVQPQIEVRRALPENAPSTWAIYNAGRMAAQVWPEKGLTEADMRRVFSDPNIKFFGKSSTDWLHMIEDESGNQAVFNGWLEGRDSPMGVARPNIQGGERWLSNVYVSKEARGQGMARALIAAAAEWHNNEPFKLLVAEYNQPAQRVYRQLGFVATGGKREYPIGIRGIRIPQLEMLHPGS